MLFAVQRTGCLPGIIVHGEDNGLDSNGLLDGLDSNGLVLGTGACFAVALSGGWPAGLGVDGIFTWAETVQGVELALDEFTGLGGRGVGVEKGVDVTCDNINDVAEEIGVVDPAGNRLGGGNGSLVSSSSEGGLGRADEASEGAWGSKSLHEGLVSDDHQDDEVPFTPGDDFGDLLLGNTGNSVGLDENTHDDLDVVCLASISDVGKSIAVGAVKTDDIESGLRDEFDIMHDTRGVLAVSIGLVWSVGNSQWLVVGGLDASTGWLGNLNSHIGHFGGDI